MIEHRAFATSARDHSKKMGINSSSRVLQFSSYVFDISVMDMLTTLMQGGTVCIPTEEEKGSLEIVGAMNRMRVNWVFFTPSFASIIDPSSVRGLETLVLGGEAMSKKHVETWAPHVRLMNGYGPTEASVLVTINTDVVDHTNIGRGVGALTWVADRTNSDRLVSVGAVGELLLEGPTLARGYLNEPPKTRAAFIDSPSWAPGRRFYKTGGKSSYIYTLGLFFSHVDADFRSCAPARGWCLYLPGKERLSSQGTWTEIGDRRNRASSRYQ